MMTMIIMMIIMKIIMMMNMMINMFLFTQLGLVCQTCSVYLTVCVSIER